MKLTWATLGLGLGVLALAGCEDGGLNFCTNRDDAGKCPDVDFPPTFDGGMDGATPPSSDGRVPDATTFVDGATVVLPDGAVVAADSGLDAATTPDAAAPASYTVEEYCAAQYRVASAWRDKFDQCCGTLTPDQITARDGFLVNALQFNNGATDSISGCVTGINNSIGPNLTYVPTAAVACAAKFASQFAGPEAACPQAGFALETLESKIGHGIQVTAQLPECRAAFVGKLALNAACTNSFTCVPGLRCLGTANSKFCSQPRSSGSACEDNSECADGLLCVGSTATGAGGRVCRPVGEPVELNSNCKFSTECRVDNFCFDKCVLPEATAICAQ